MLSISTPVRRKDHDAKVSGRALYVDDLAPPGMLYGKLLHSTQARAKILDIQIPSLPDGYWIVGKDDVPGSNSVHVIQDDMPVFAEGMVEYAGEAILMLVGPDPQGIRELMDRIAVSYETLTPELDPTRSETVFAQYEYSKGDVEQAFAEADRIFTETFQTGHQEHAYLEPQGILAELQDGKLILHGSLQCPYYVHGAIAQALGVEGKDVRVIQSVTGGGFGGKEDFPSILGCQTAVAAKKTGKPVKVIFDREEDISFTTKRHPSICKYRVAVKDGRITGMDAEILLDGGAYTTLSPVVLQRGIISASGVYKIDSLRVSGRAVKTNSVPSGAFRGFGAPQVFFAIETMMDHIAWNLQRDPVEFKRTHLVRQGDATSTSGRYHDPVPLPGMLDRIDGISGYQEKCKRFQNQDGRYRKGIGLALFFHGGGFTGSGEREHIKAVARLKKHKDDSVELLVSNTEIGQGLHTTFSKLIAHTLGIPYEKVRVGAADTDLVPDSGPTVASRSMMIVGELLRRGAERMKRGWDPGKEMLVEEHYADPDFLLPFDLERFQGDAYPTYSWGVNAIEVEVDTLTGSTKIAGAWGVYDVGVAIDETVIHGQMQGGMIQGIGYASMEQIGYDGQGRIRNNSFSDYHIPTAMDVPDLITELVENPYPFGPLGAKGTGELSFVGAAPAYLHAVEQALGTTLNHIPLTQEDLML